MVANASDSVSLKWVVIYLLLALGLAVLAVSAVGGSLVSPA